MTADDDFEPSVTTRRNKTPDENLAQIEDYHSDVVCWCVASLKLLRAPHAGMEAMRSLPTASVEAKQSRILSGSPYRYRTFVERRHVT
jgi:hypothetical protein